MSSSVPAGIRCTVGVLVFGAIANAIVYGATTMRSYHYFTRFQRDSLFMKIMVGVIWSINTLQVTFDMVAVDHYVLKNYANYPVLDRLHWSLSAVMVLAVVGSATIRIFLVHLIWQISKAQWYFRIPALIFSCISMSTGLALSIKLLVDGTIHGTKAVTYLAFSTFATAVICDLVIAISICYLLTRAQTGRQLLDNVLHMLGLYFVKSGLVITACNIASVISFSFMRHNCVYMAIFFFSFSFYFLSLLSILTSRDDLRARMGSIVTSLPMHQLSPLSPQSSTLVYGHPTSKMGSISQAAAISISVETETDILVDRVAIPKTSFSHCQKQSSNTANLTTNSSRVQW
ncbi:hypothetical protein SCHPADRAFT_3313 [Schizopora paradoxa]|uniref:DUF6534 domain-containing protein n=1 Tax=Schizopora paradoxa TaxID=27342 RepID=A0A0H2STA9_9AGAM|nr:hypothetical protein SCHPADRAFT_3313 [Schizopora paradoxa]